MNEAIYLLRVTLRFRATMLVQHRPDGWAAYWAPEDVWHTVSSGNHRTPLRAVKAFAAAIREDEHEIAEACRNA